MVFHKHILFLAFMVLPLIAPAQDEKEENGAKYLLGVSSQFAISNNNSITFIGFGSSHKQLNLNATSSEHLDNYWGLNLAPKVGFFISPYIIAGIDGHYGIGSRSSASNYQILKSEQLIIAPFIRVCLSANHKKLIPFIEISSGFGMLRNQISSDSLSINERSDLFRYGGLFGVLIPMSKSTFLDIGLLYCSNFSRKRQNNPFKERIIENSIGFQIGFVLFI